MEHRDRLDQAMLIDVEILEYMLLEALDPFQIDPILPRHPLHTAPLKLPGFHEEHYILLRRRRLEQQNHQYRGH